jgi:transcription termination factor NusB
MGLRRKGRVIAFQALYFWDVTHPDPEDLLRFDWLDDVANSHVHLPASFSRVFWRISTALTRQYAGNSSTGISPD